MHKIISAGRHILTYQVGFHKHDFWELVYCTSGSGRFRAKGGDEVEYKKGDVICIAPGIEHCNLSEEGFQNVHLVMDNIALPSHNFVKIRDNSSQILLHSFMQSFYFFSYDTHDKHAIMATLGELIATCLFAFIDLVSYSPLVEKIRIEIIRNFTDSEFSVARLLQTRANNAEYVRKLFKKETGETPLQFLTNTRLNYAKKLLKSKLSFNTINVSEVARECGFEDTLYFSRLFKKHTGLSPISYVKHLHQIEAQAESQEESQEEQKQTPKTD